MSMPASDLAPEALSTSLPLAELPPGASARLIGTRLDGDTRHLLRALGLTDASTIRVCKRGEPFIIQVRATRIGLSRAVAQGILVRPEVAQPRQSGAS